MADMINNITKHQNNVQLSPCLPQTDLFLFLLVVANDFYSFAAVQRDKNIVGTTCR